MYRFVCILVIVTSIKINAQEEVPLDAVSDKVHISINGTLSFTKNIIGEKFSENGIYRVNYDIGEVTDGNRKLYNISLYENDELIYFLQEAPGADFDISNSGILLFYDHTFHFSGKITLHFFSKFGDRLFTKEYSGANLFAFSQSGNMFGLRTPDGIFTIDLISLEENRFEKGYAFSFDESDKYIAIVSERTLSVYKNSVSVLTIKNDMLLPRKVVISESAGVVAVIDKRNLEVYSFNNGDFIFRDILEGEYSFRDLKIFEGNIAAGIHRRNDEISKGILKIYNPGDNHSKTIDGESKKLIKHTKTENLRKSDTGYEPIPWPFYPFDSTRTAWNHYEQHMGHGSGDWSYLHQGYDIITPIGENTFAVKSGVVKLVLTIGGASYWRIAISDSQQAGYSDGWLYAHLIENTIQFDVGDTVQQHDYLGDIVEWTSQWGHIHFVEIRDSGLVWFYEDNEWGINFNPLLALTPVDDIIPPVIENVFPNSKFAFCTNETSNYLEPDSLFGEIDIIVKVVDYIGDSEWQQPAFETYYWIKRTEDDEIIQERTHGHILNHKYDMYNSGYYEPYAVVLYKRDNLLPSPPWMNPERNFYHILTHSKGDSLIDPSDTQLAFNTAGYKDGQYRIYVEAFDVNGNSVLDSMDVFFKNGIVNVSETDKPLTYSLLQNYPNPFNPSTKLKFTISDLRFTSLKVYDVLGREVATLVNEEKPAGSYEVVFSAESFGDASQLPSGGYFYRLTAGNFTSTKKMILLR
jgi:murein DD-endopeptidase MepM/ murein hydrolase activator NlpD